MDRARRLSLYPHDGADDELSLCGACGCSVCLSQAGFDGAARGEQPAGATRHSACLPAVRRNRYPFLPP